MNYVHASCPSVDPSDLWLVNLQMSSVRLHISDTAQTSPRPGCPCLEKMQWVMVISMVHPGVDLLAGPVLGRMTGKSRAWGLLG